MVDALLDVGANLHVLAAFRRTELLNARYLFAEADTTRAVNAASHVRGYQRPDVLVFDHALAFVIAGDIPTVSEREVLQLALAALITDRAVQRMID